MCPDPVLPTEPVYGDNNWCYRNERTYAYNVLTNITEVAAAHGKTEVEEIKRKQRVSGFNSIFAVSSVSAAKLYYDDLEKTFTDEQKEIFEKFHDCWDEYVNFAEAAIFEYAFKLGMKIAIEILTE